MASTAILTYMPLVICFVQFFFILLLIYFAYYIIGIIFLVSEIRAGYTRVHPCTPYPLFPQSFFFLLLFLFFHFLKYCNAIFNVISTLLTLFLLIFSKPYEVKLLSIYS